KYAVTWEGVLTNLERRYKETESDWVRADIERYMVPVPCDACGGARLKPEMLAVTVASPDGNERSIVDVARMSVADSLAWTEGLRDESGTPLSARDYSIA